MPHEGWYAIKEKKSKPNCFFISPAIQVKTKDQLKIEKAFKTLNFYKF